ncbi:MAG: sporulation protein YqfD [Firmicutes bacterium]|nr:sporulation protein YqfD [Bacillota bacterium]
MSDFIFRLFAGWIKVQAQGDGVESLVTSLVTAGFRLWNLQPAETGYVFYTTLSAMSPIREYMVVHSLDIRILQQGGAPIEWNRSRRRPFLWVGLATAAMLIIYVTSRIWVIDALTPGLSPGARQQLVTVAEDAGLRMGTVRNQVNLPRIRVMMSKRLPQYSWIGISLHGVVATIQVVPLVPRPPLHIYARIVASSPGRVTRILVYIGDPEVVPGDWVKAGQTLIRGAVTAPVPLPEGSEKNPVQDTMVTPAEGEVWANVTHRVTVFQPLRQATSYPTGRKYIRQFIWVQDVAPWQYWGWQPVPFAHYVEKKEIYSVQWEGVNLPVKVLKIVYNETNTKVRRLQPGQAVAEATRRATTEMARAVAGLGPVVEKSRQIRRTQNGVWVSIVWVVNQNIALPKDRN